MTTRKRIARSSDARTLPPGDPRSRRTLTQRRGAVFALLAGLAGFTTGCATRGPLHVYAVAGSGERPVVDTGDGRTVEVPSFLAPDDWVSGFAYDPFTDHFFLRLAPGDRIRVVDRPARAIKREFEIAGAPRGGGDLAIRPRDGHLFLLGAQPGQVLQATRLGRFIGEIALENVREPLQGLALDSAQDRLLALAADDRRVFVHDLRGRFIRQLQLDRPAGPSLAFDAEQREFHAPLRGRPGEIGIFDDTGRLRRTVPAPAGPGLIDVGPRSFVRVF